MKQTSGTTEDLGRQQHRLSLYARLASLSSLDVLNNKERQQLINLAKRAGYELLDATDVMQKPPTWQKWAEREWKKRHRPSQQEAEEVLRQPPQKKLTDWLNAAKHVNLERMVNRGEMVPSYWDALQAAHPVARKLIGDLLKVGMSRVPSLPNLTRFILTLDEGQVTEHYVGPDAGEEIIFDLLQSIRQRPFPFRCCPRCKSIFLRSRKQKYCSATCLEEAWTYKENPERREQIRKAQQRFRKKKKRQSMPGRSTDPRLTFQP